MGTIAERWDRLSDADKVAELRAPTFTRPRQTMTTGAAVDLVSEKVIGLRKAARELPHPTLRTAMVEGWIINFRTRASEAGWPAALTDTVERVVRSETIDWPEFGQRVYRS